MCFIVKQRTAQITEKDIECFKILLKSKKILRSPIQSKTWQVGKTVSENRLIRIRKQTNGYLDVGLHSFKTLKQAERYRRRITRGDKLYIFPAIIPAGSVYWTNNTQYCSDALTIVSSDPVGLDIRKK